jgi:hypothetical protein
MELGSIKTLLRGSPYKSKAKEIAAAFDGIGVKTLSDLDNAARSLPLDLFGFSVYQVIAYIRQAAIARVIAKSEPEPKPEPEPEPEPEEVTPEEPLVDTEDKE